MARMYFNFNTNLPDSKTSKCLAAVDYIAFEGKKGEIISVSCNQDSDWHIENGEYNARFKGLEVKIEGTNKNEYTYLIHDYKEMSLEDFNMLQGATPYEIGFQEDDYLPDIIKCENVDIRIEIYDNENHNTLITDYTAEELSVM